MAVYRLLLYTIDFPQLELKYTAKAFLIFCGFRLALILAVTYRVSDVLIDFRMSFFKMLNKCSRYCFALSLSKVSKNFF